MLGITALMVGSLSLLSSRAQAQTCRPVDLIEVSTGSTILVKSACINTVNGDNIIDPNECLDLYVNFQNNTGGTRTGINGLLSLPGGFTSGSVTQNTSPFPDVVNTATTTNTTPFRLSIPPGVECGTRLPFTLNLTTTQGNLSTTFTLFVGTVGPSANACQPVNNIAINDRADPEFSPVTVTGVVGPVSKLRVKVFVDHPEISQLDVLLQHPDGTIIILATRETAPGVLGANMGQDSPCTDNNDTIFDDSAALAINQGTAPFIGTFRPTQQLSLLAGKPANGIWNLICVDRVRGKAGQIRCWCLDIAGFTCAASNGECGVDLAVTKSDFPDPVAIDCPLTYTITVTNNGTDTASSVTIQDILPPAVDFVSASSGCTPIGGDVYCDVGSLAVGTTKTVTVTVIPRAIGTLTNFTYVVSDGNETNWADNTTSITTTVAPDCNRNCVPDAQDIASGTSKDCNNNNVPDECDIAAGTSQDVNGNGIPDECETADLSVTKTDAPDPVAVDCPLTYTIVVANAGPSPATGAAVTDGFPASFSVTSTVPAPTSVVGNIYTWTFGTLASGASTTVTVVGTYPSVGLKTNIVETTTTAADPNLANNLVQVQTQVTPDCNANCIPDPQEPDCNANGIPDGCDITSGTSQDCNNNGVPDECDIADGAPDCNNNGIPDECETDCNANGVPDDCDITTGGIPDCNQNGVPDSCDIANGAPDCNNNGIPDECETDCNANGVPDDCDVTTGGIPDCNNNGVPDSCDITSGAADCNNNGVPDECETDCNANGVPDDCDITTGGIPTATRTASPTRATSARGRAMTATTTPSPTSASATATPTAFPTTATSPRAACPTVTTTAFPTAATSPTARPTATTTGSPRVRDPTATPTAFRTTATSPRAAFRTATRTACPTAAISPTARPTATTTGSPTSASTDCNANGVPDDCDITTGGIPDCNGNGVPDSCDIANGAADCNNNGIPDECETDVQRDATAVPDDCDITTGGSDCNDNGVPDSCDITTADRLQQQRHPRRVRGRLQRQRRSGRLRHHRRAGSPTATRTACLIRATSARGRAMTATTTASPTSASWRRLQRQRRSRRLRHHHGRDPRLQPERRTRQLRHSQRCGRLQRQRHPRRVD